MVHPDGEDGGRSSHHSDLENHLLQEVDYDEDTGDQNTIHSTLPFGLYSACYHYFHSLPLTLINAPPPKHFH